MEKDESVIKYQIKQTSLKKGLKKLKKKIPFSIGLFIFFSVILLALIDKELFELLGKSGNIVLISSIILVILLMIYIVFIFIKLKKINNEIKYLGEKIYNKMKL